MKLVVLKQYLGGQILSRTLVPSKKTASMLSSRGVYEHIVDWRRNEDDGGVFIGQQLYGAYGRNGYFFDRQIWSKL